MPEVVLDAETLAVWLCDWWDGQENDEHAEDVPCVLCRAQAESLFASGLIPLGTLTEQYAVRLAADDSLVVDGFSREGTLLRLDRRDSVPLRRGEALVRTLTTYPDRATDWEPLNRPVQGSGGDGS